MIEFALKTCSERIQFAPAFAHAIGETIEFLHGSGELAQAGMGIVDIERDRAASSGIDDRTSFGDRETFSRIKTTRSDTDLAISSHPISFDAARFRSMPTMSWWLFALKTRSYCNDPIANRLVKNFFVVPSNKL